MSVRVHDSITKLDAEDEGSVAIAASHGGVYSGYCAAKARLRGVVFCDAGVGLERAGIGSLAYLDALGMPAATVDFRSARIGDGADLARRGTISFCNASARERGCAPGDAARACAEKMLGAAAYRGDAPAYAEARTLLLERPRAPNVWGLDSVSLVRSGDAGAIVLTGSHGGLLGGDPASALRVDAIAAAYNDAGVGCDDAGISRLPALQERGIAAVTVAADSARIGDAKSAWETGRISHMNPLAQAYGARAGMTLPAFVEWVLRAIG
ncbi:MAG: hypothetical protein JO140_01045 [Candidatus Eremiobacteraeota bacterium]|nr:hypothetical protein [Candidatus Eremiobacteraeota bacterium]